MRFFTTGSMGCLAIFFFSLWSLCVSQECHTACGIAPRTISTVSLFAMLCSQTAVSLSGIIFGWFYWYSTHLHHTNDHSFFCVFGTSLFCVKKVSSLHFLGNVKPCCNDTLFGVNTIVSFLCSTANQDPDDSTTASSQIYTVVHHRDQLSKISWRQCNGFIQKYTACG